MDGGVWKAAVHGFAESWTRLNDFTFIFHFHALEKEMATHSSVLAWRIPGTAEPGGLPSMGMHRVGHNWSDLAAAAESALEKAMAPHSSILAWKISWMEEPGRLQSMKLLRVGHDWVTSLSLFTFMPGRRKWQPTPVFLPGESQGWGSLVAAIYGVTQSQTWLKRLSSSSSSRICLQCGRPRFDPWVRKIPWRRERLPTVVFWSGEFHGLYGPRGRKESDMTERLSLSPH